MNLNDPQLPYDLIAQLGSVLSSPQRVRILHLLCQCDRTVEELAKAMNQPVANVSHHLQLMRNANLVAARRMGRHIAYGVPSEEVKNFWVNYRDFSATRLAELDRLTGALAAQRTKRGGIINRDTIKELLKKNAVVLVDVRPREEYDASHLPGAISVPLPELMDHMKELSANQIIVLYCRGPYCLLGDVAQEKLAAAAIRALRLNEGAVDWAVAGLSVEHSPGHTPLIPHNSS